MNIIKLYQHVKLLNQDMAETSTMIHNNLHENVAGHVDQTNLSTTLMLILALKLTRALLGALKV